MKNLSLSLMIFLASTPVVQADNCARLAEQKAAELGAQVLAARSEGGNCVVTLRIPGKGGEPPRVDTIVIGG